MEQRAARYLCATALVALATATVAATTASAQTDRIYFPAVHDVRSVLVSRIQTETVRIDMSAWLLTERAVTVALRDAFRRGVQVRLIGDRAAIFEIDANTRNEFYWLASQGVPIRLRSNPSWFPEISHWKATIFKGQRLVAFGSANYTANQLAPSSATNYSDETVLFTTDPSLVGAFLTKFDVMWNDSTGEPESRVAAPPYLMNWDDACAAESRCSSYRSLYPSPVPMLVSTARLEPDRAMPADLVWGQGAAFNRRLIREIANESRLVRLVAYRLTVPDVTQALIDKARSGVPVRIIIEPSEYLKRTWPEFWLTHANIDRLWAAGVRIKQRRHAGLTHMKMLVTSRYATNASSNYAANWQRDHDYFVSASAKPAVYRAMADRFDAMWNDAEGFGAFSPGPPDRPSLASPLPGSSAIPGDMPLTWRAAPFATNYDVYLGSSPGSLALVARVPAKLVNDPPSTYSWAPPGPVASGTTFYWKVVATSHATPRNASLVGDSGIWSFTTLGTRGHGVPAAPSVFRRSTGRWYTMGDASPAFGNSADIPVPADYDGDGRTDPAVWRPSTGTWWILPSGTGATMNVRWGNGAWKDVPVPGDYDGDGRGDLAVWRPETGAWWVLESSSGYSVSRRRMIQWGAPDDHPVPADYDGDGATDIAVFRPRTGTWWVLTSATAFHPSHRLVVQWGHGQSGDVPVPADYDGDGQADIAVWRPEGGVWWILVSSDGYRYDGRLRVQWGFGTQDDVPVPVDYDGDGRADIAVWRPASAQWFIRRSFTGYSTHQAVQWGNSAAGDIPLLAGWSAMQRYLRR